MLATEYLRPKVRTGTVAYLSTQKSAYYLEELGLHTLSVADLDLDDTDEVNALVFLDDEGFDWNHDINKIVILLRVRNIPCVVANTDKSYPLSDDKVSIAIGGNKFGIDTALVLTSNTLRSTVEEQIHLMGIVPDFIYQSG